MVRSGDSLTQLVTFDEGFPDAAVTWVLRDGAGVQIATGTITPASGAVSVTILVSGTHNTLTGSDLFANRELSWSYATSGNIVRGALRYDVEAFLGFGVSREGVRGKLGLLEDECPDSDINLVHAYAEFRNTVTQTVFDAVTDSYKKLVVRQAIEALAALKLVPSLQVRLASKEVSGVSQFQRSRIDWEALSAYLNSLLAEGYTLLNPSLDPANTGSIFLTVTRDPDPVTGTTPA